MSPFCLSVRQFVIAVRMLLGAINKTAERCVWGAATYDGVGCGWSMVSIRVLGRETGRRGGCRQVEEWVHQTLLPGGQGLVPGLGGLGGL